MAQDLAHIHHPISSMFAWPQSREEWETLQLPAEQVEFFREHGYVAGIRLLEPDQIEQLRAELAEFFDEDHAGREFWYEYHSNESVDRSQVLFHALGAWRLRTGFHDLLWCPRLLAIASQLLAGDVRFWHDQLFCKPARHGGVVAWHQDYSYWTRTEPMAHLTCWIGLDRSTRDNGCLKYIPGSHLWDLLPITGLAGDMQAIREVLTPAQWQAFESPVDIELAAGECSFHHPLMVHGSEANQTDQPRRATVVNLVRDGVCSATTDSLLAGVAPIPPGEPLAGTFFPLLFSRAAV